MHEGEQQRAGKKIVLVKVVGLAGRLEATGKLSVSCNPLTEINYFLCVCRLSRGYRRCNCSICINAKTSSDFGLDTEIY